MLRLPLLMSVSDHHKEIQIPPDSQPLQNSLILLHIKINTASLMTYDTADSQQPAVR